MERQYSPLFLSLPPSQISDTTEGTDGTTANGDKKKPRKLGLYLEGVQSKKKVKVCASITYPSSSASVLQEDCPHFKYNCGHNPYRPYRPWVISCDFSVTVNTKAWLLPCVFVDMLHATVLGGFGGFFLPKILFAFSHPVNREQAVHNYQGVN